MCKVKRRSGRTTRMLADALRLAKEGRAVYVVAADGRQAADLRQIAGQEAEILGVKFESPASISNHLDWGRMRLIGAHENCVVLADHYAIERHFGALLEMYHRYNEVPAEEKEGLMHTEEKSAYIMSQVACMLAELSAMWAAHNERFRKGQVEAYPEEEFWRLLERYGLDHNAVK